MKPMRRVLLVVVFAGGCSPEECSDDTAWFRVEISATRTAAELPLTVIRLKGWQHTGDWARDENGTIQSCGYRELQRATVTLDSASGVRTLAWRERVEKTFRDAAYETTLDGYDSTYEIDLEEGWDTHRNRFEAPVLHTVAVTSTVDGVLAQWSPAGLPDEDATVNVWYPGFSYPSWVHKDSMADGVEVIPSSVFAGRDGPFRIEVVRAGRDLDTFNVPGTVSRSWSLSVDATLATP